MNQRGFSMLQVVLAMGLAGVLGMFVLQMQTVQTKGMKTTEIQMERNTVMNRMASLFAKRDICNLNFKDKKAGDTFTQIMHKPATAVYKITEDVIPNSLRIDRMTLVSNSTGLLSLDVQFSTVNQLALGGKEMIKSIPIQAELDGDGKIIDCYSDESNLIKTSVAKACESLDATFDTATQKCKMTNLPRCMWVSDPCTGLFSNQEGSYLLSEHSIFLFKCCQP